MITTGQKRIYFFLFLTLLQKQKDYRPRGLFMSGQKDHSKGITPQLVDSVSTKYGSTKQNITISQ